MYVTVPQKHLEIQEKVQVLVIGGGSAGLGAAISASRMGCDTMLLEKRGFLGGNVTACYVETCNHYLHNNDFTPPGISNEIEKGYDAAFASDDIRPNAPHRYNSEKLKIFLDRLVISEGIRIKLHSFVNDVVVNDGHIEAVIIQTKQGPVAVAADIIIDCSGDGDVAFAAGVPFEQGRDTDHLCQPGTVNARFAGADVNELMKDGDGLKDIGRTFREDYRSRKTGLSCYRQDLPTGRLTKAGIISYINYACEYRIDPTNSDDLTRGEIACRSYVYELLEYLRGRYTELNDLELVSIAPEIGFRDSRRITGQYHLTMEDIETQKRFDDCIAVYPKFYDMLTPDPDKLITGNGKVSGRGYEGHIYEPIRDNSRFQIPYRCLVPINIDNLLVAGRCICSDHVAQSALRAISLCTMTGEAAGAAAGLALKKSCTVSNIPVEELQAILRGRGFDIP